MYKIAKETLKKEKDHVHVVQSSRISKKKNKNNNSFVSKTKKDISGIKKDKYTCHHYGNDDY